MARSRSARAVIVLAAALTITIIGATPTIASSSALTFEDDARVAVPDPGLRQVILKTLGLEPGHQLRARDLSRLTELVASDAKIRDLRGLEHATALKNLILPRNHISNLSPLAGLHGLRHLELRANDVVDVSPLRGLRGLEWLSLVNNRVLDGSALGALEKRGVHIDGGGQGQGWGNSESDVASYLTIGTFRLRPDSFGLTYWVRQLVDFSGSRAWPVAKDGMAYSTLGETITWHDITPDMTSLPFRFSNASGTFHGMARLRIERTPTTSSASPTPTTAAPSASPTPTSTVPAWNPSAAYRAGALVTWRGRTYQAVQSYQGWGDRGWITAPSLWKQVG